MMDFIIRHRRSFVTGTHLGLVVVSNYLAFWLRFDSAIPQEDWDLFVAVLPWLLAVRNLLFIPFRLYEGLWRYTGIWDLRNIIAGVGLSTALFYMLVHGLFDATAYPGRSF